MGVLPIKRVVQLDENGCGVACVAMLAGVSYRNARMKMLEDWYVKGMDTKELRKALRRFRLSSARRLIRSIKRRRYTTLQQDAILKVRLPKRFGSKWH
jgi:hypothetical protein